MESLSHGLRRMLTTPARAALRNGRVGVQGVVQEEGGEGKEGGGDACEEAKTAIRGGGAREGGVPETGVVYVGEYVVGGDGAGAQAGTVAVAARPVEVTRTGMGQGREMGMRAWRRRLRKQGSTSGMRREMRQAPKTEREVTNKCETISLMERG